jgi:hypothetical protein
LSLCQVDLLAQSACRFLAENASCLDVFGKPFSRNLDALGAKGPEKTALALRGAGDLLEVF